ncbi:MAG: hypothetical protein AB1505_21485 [Candidatus Latescibacterota bacterium]
MFGKVFLVSLALLAGAVLLVAQEPATPPPARPGLVIPLPEGMTLPPAETGVEVYEAMVENVFFAIAGDDGLMSVEELKDWLREHGPRPGPLFRPEGDMGGTMHPGPGAQGTDASADAYGSGADFPALPDPPACTAEVLTSQAAPLRTGQSCGSSSGNLVFRTVCNTDGFSVQTISMPEGRTAGCFGIEAITKNVVIVYIYPEDDPSNMIFDSDRDGLDRIGDVQLTDAGVYRLELDMDRSDPDARVTVRFVDY